MGRAVGPCQHQSVKFCAMQRFPAIPVFKPFFTDALAPHLSHIPPAFLPASGKLRRPRGAPLSVASRSEPLIGPRSLTGT